MSCSYLILNINLFKFNTEGKFQFPGENENHFCGYQMYIPHKVSPPLSHVFFTLTPSFVRFPRFLQVSTGSQGFYRFLQVPKVSTGFYRFLQVSTGFYRFPWFLQVSTGFYRFIQQIPGRL